SARRFQTRLSPPGTEVGFSESLSNRQSDGANHTIADRMAVCVVHLLETIDVDEQQGHWSAVAACALEFFTYVLTERTSIRQAGQRVRLRERREPICLTSQ